MLIAVVILLGLMRSYRFGMLLLMLSFTFGLCMRSFSGYSFCL